MRLDKNGVSTDDVPVLRAEDLRELWGESGGAIAMRQERTAVREGVVSRGMRAAMRGRREEDVF